MSTLLNIDLPAQIEFISFSSDLVVAKHLLAAWRVLQDGNDQWRQIEVHLVNGATLLSRIGVPPIPAYVRKQLGIGLGGA